MLRKSPTLSKRPFIFLIILLTFLPQVSETIYSPALPEICYSLNTSTTIAEWTLTTYFLGFALGVASLGKISDHIGRRPTILAGLFMYTLVSFFCTLVSNIYVLLLLRIFQGFAISVGSVITQIIIRDCFSGSRSNQIFSITGATIGLAPAFGSIIGGYLVQYYHWHSILFALVVAGCMLFVYSILYLPETINRVENNPMNRSISYLTCMQKMLLDRHVLASTVMIGVFNGMLFSYYANAPFIFINLFKMKANHYGFLGIFMSIGVVFGSTLSFYLNKKSTISPNKLIQIACRINLCIMILYVFFSISNIISTYNNELSIVLITVIMSIFYFSFGLAIPNILSLALVSYQQSQGTASSIFGFFYYTLVACVLMGMGIISHFSIKGMSIYYLVLAVLLVYATRFLNKS